MQIFCLGQSKLISDTTSDKIREKKALDAKVHCVRAFLARECLYIYDMSNIQERLDSVYRWMYRNSSQLNVMRLQLGGSSVRITFIVAQIFLVLPCC